MSSARLGQWFLRECCPSATTRKLKARVHSGRSHGSGKTGLAMSHKLALRGAGRGMRLKLLAAGFIAVSLSFEAVAAHADSFGCNATVSLSNLILFGKAISGILAPVPWRWFSGRQWDFSQRNPRSDLQSHRIFSVFDSYQRPALPRPFLALALLLSPVIPLSLTQSRLLPWVELSPNVGDGRDQAAAVCGPVAHRTI
jgi:hypothetical protein